MSIFDLPRVNFRGRLRLNPGTANNEDYAQPGKDTQALLPQSWPDPRYRGQPLGLLQSKPVRVQRYGLDDAAYVDWIQRQHQFDTPSGKSIPVFPAEWNYYGDMGSEAVGVTVVGVEDANGLHTTEDGSVPLTGVLGAELTLTGSITDINPEGSPPATQFFVGSFGLSGGGTTWIGTCQNLKNGCQISKGTGLWINFFRNANAAGDAGAGSYLHHVVTGADVTIPGFEDALGIVLRYYVALAELDDPETSKDPKVMRHYYTEGKPNPKTLDIVGTISPWRRDYPVASPVGRQLISRSQNVPTPGQNNNGSGCLALGPAVAQRQGDRLAVDFIGTFPDDKQGNSNDKLDFGPVSLHAVAGDGASEPIASIDYTAMEGSVQQGDARGWVYDLQIPAAAGGLLDRGAVLSLRSDEHGEVLREVDYFVVPSGSAVYGQQYGRGDQFVAQGAPRQLSVAVYHRGERLSARDCPPISMWSYSSVPIQDPGTAHLVTAALAPDQPITVPTRLAGAYLLTFRVDGETNPPESGFPPAGYGQFAYPPEFTVTWAPQVSVRILPNEDYRAYYDPGPDGPVGNERLTFAFLYDNVLRTYDLLFPAMKQYFDLGDAGAVAKNASAILATTDPNQWLSPHYMPRTHDLSDTRRTLLQAWCRKVKAQMGG